MLKRYFIELSYNGKAYHGWQIQENALSVQQVLNEVLQTTLRQAVETVGCGRTDTGVHALQHFVHLDTDIELNDKHMHSMNAMLPSDIGIKRIIPVARDAHARFDATLRSYQYHVHFQKNPFRNDFSWFLREIPDLKLMNRAAAILIEYTDFSCFSKSNTQTFTNNCKISRAVWEPSEYGFVFHISADRFLRNMVRAIVGTLLEVGYGNMEPEMLRKIIDSKDRSNAGVSVPACGLYLSEVKYPNIQ